MTGQQQRLRCAIYTRKSSDEGLEQAFNSLHAQREACEAYIRSQAHEGWKLIPRCFDDGGLSGGTLERPALQQLLQEIAARRVDVVVVYKIDRLTRSLTDFARLAERFDQNGVSFVSVTQQFNTTTSMGRLVLNVLLSFAQFEREVTAERIRDKIAASKRKGMWMGGMVPTGYAVKERRLVINETEAGTIKRLFEVYERSGTVRLVKQEADRLKLKTPIKRYASGRTTGGRSFSRGHIYKILGNPLYVGRIVHKNNTFDGQHEAIITTDQWERVQQKLQSQAARRKVAHNTKEPSLLAGLLFTNDGARFVTDHATKKSKRYRYYVGKPSDAADYSDSLPPLRIPAHDIEAVIAMEVQRLLKSPVELIGAAVGFSASDHTRLATSALRLADHWPGLGTCEQRDMLVNFVQRITIAEEELSIVVNRTALTELLLGKGKRRSTPATEKKHHPNAHLTAEGVVGTDVPDVGRDTAQNQLTIKRPLTFRRRSGMLRLILPSGQSPSPTAKPNQALVNAIARAHVWKEALIAGEYNSIPEIAHLDGVTRRYVSRILVAAFLAPDIVEQILSADRLSSPILEELRSPPPLLWRHQRQTLLSGLQPDSHKLPCCGR